MRYSPARLRAARTARGFTREAVARGIDRTAGTIYRYETGTVAPTVHVLGALAAFYRVAVDDLYERDGETAAEGAAR